MSLTRDGGGAVGPEGSDHVLGKKKKADQAKEGRGKPKDCGMKLGSRSDHQRSSCRILGCL